MQFVLKMFSSPNRIGPKIIFSLGALFTRSRIRGRWKKYSKQRVLRWDECCSLRRGLYNAGLVCTEKPSTKLVPLIPRLTTGRQPRQMISQNQLNTTCGYPKEMKRSVIQRFQPCLCPCAPPTPAPQSWRRGGNTSDLSATTQPPRILLSSSPCVARTQPARHPSYTLNLFNLKI